MISRLKTAGSRILHPQRGVYRWFSRNATATHFSEEEVAAEGFVSKSGQDKWIIETLFPGCREGEFVDVGANDGVRFSNTYGLEKQYGWTGLALKPMPDVFERLRANRTCRLVHGCANECAGERNFRIISGYGSMLSGLADGYDPRHSKRINETIKTHGGSIRDITVSCYRLADLFLES